MIQEWFGVQSGTELQTWELQRRNSALKFLKDKGLSQRQIERLTGISRRVIKDI
jgi:transcriptional regulator with XRE-family HTH domain